MVQLQFRDRLKVINLNVRSINNNIKKRKVFRFLKKQKADVYLIQESHCQKNKEFLWESEWGNKCYFSNGTSQSSGVAILLNKGCNSGVEEVRRDMNGRFFQLKLEIEEYTYCITNIYAPNSDNPDYFKDTFQKVNEADSVFNIIGGDFNVVRNAKIDRNRQIVYHSQSKRS